MRIISIILLVFVLGLTSCDKTHIEKPDNLLTEKQMVEILVDVHLAEATFQNRRSTDENVKKSSSINFYYSVLNKHHVADSVFEKSFVYFAGNPKEFEKTYRKVMNILNEKEKEFSGRKNEPLDFDIEE